MLNLTKCATQLGLPAHHTACSFQGVGRLLLTPTRASLLLDWSVPDTNSEAFLMAAQQLPLCIGARTPNGAGVLHFCCDAPQEQNQDFLASLTQALAQFATPMGATHG